MLSFYLFKTNENLFNDKNVMDKGRFDSSCVECDMAVKVPSSLSAVHTTACYSVLVDS